jgi:hypothetical protein
VRALPRAHGLAGAIDAGVARARRWLELATGAAPGRARAGSPGRRGVRRLPRVDRRGAGPRAGRGERSVRGERDVALDGDGGDVLVPARGRARRQRDRGSSEACSACHDVRLFGTDVAGVAARGEHFKRLRNAYSEWRAWAGDEARAGRTAPTCQGCHMSLFPGVCVEGARTGTGDRGCPSGTRFEARAPGSRPPGRIAPDSASTSPIASHAFASVDVPLGRDLEDASIDDPRVDASGTPLGVRARRDLLLSHALRLAIDHPRRTGAGLEVPIVIENVGAGHRVPAGFSQEREIWVELSIADLGGRSVYRVGHLDRPDGACATRSSRR